MLQFLLRYSKIYPWLVKILYYLNPFTKTTKCELFTFERNTRQPYIDNLCLFRTLALHLKSNDKSAEETSKSFILSLTNCEEGDFSKVQGIHLSDFPKIEDMLQLNIFLYDIDFVEGELIAEFARRSFRKYDNSIKLFR